MNVYIILGILYLVYTIYSRYRNAEANRPKIGTPQAGQGDTQQPTAPEDLLERLRRLAREQEERQNAEARERQRQQERALQTAPSTQEQEYPDEWILTETGTKVHDLEGRKLRQEYLNSKEQNASRETNLREEYIASRQPQSSEMTMVEEYLAAHAQGRPIQHGKHGHGSGRLAQTNETKRVQSRVKKVHVLKKELFNGHNVRRAFILKEVLERPKH